MNCVLWFWFRWNCEIVSFCFHEPSVKAVTMLLSCADTLQCSWSTCASILKSRIKYAGGVFLFESVDIWLKGLFLFLLFFECFADICLHLRILWEELLVAKEGFQRVPGAKIVDGCYFFLDYSCCFSFSFFTEFPFRQLFYPWHWYFFVFFLEF